MDSVDFFHYTLGIGFLILVGCLSYMTHEAVLLFRSVRGLIDRLDDVVANIEDVAASVKEVKNNFKVGIASIVSNILGYFLANRSNKKGGE